VWESAESVAPRVVGELPRSSSRRRQVGSRHAISASGGAASLSAARPRSDRQLVDASERLLKSQRDVSAQRVRVDRLCRKPKCAGFMRQPQ